MVSNVWMRVGLNAAVTGLITTISIMAATHWGEVTNATIYAAIMAGLFAGLKEVQGMVDKNDPKAKPRTSPLRTMLAHATFV